MISFHLEYCALFWSPWLKKDLKELGQGKVKKRGAKIIKGLEHFSYEESLKSLGPLCLEKRQLSGYMMKVYKIMGIVETVAERSFFPLPKYKNRDIQWSWWAVDLECRKKEMLIYSVNDKCVISFQNDGLWHR